MTTKEMIMATSFRELLGLAPKYPDDGGTRRSIHVDPTDMSLHVTGYTADEVRDLLGVYREHQEAMTVLMVKMAETNAQLVASNASADAVRYTPGGHGEAWSPVGPEDV